jgi:nucleotide-binding universal stress UspA family protein
MSDLPEILLVPVDGSKNASAAASYAARLAEKLGVPVRLLFAFPESPWTCSVGPRRRTGRKS